jgi:hypothetical protein
MFRLWQFMILKLFLFFLLKYDRMNKISIIAAECVHGRVCPRAHAPRRAGRGRTGRRTRKSVCDERSLSEEQRIASIFLASHVKRKSPEKRANNIFCEKKKKESRKAFSRLYNA